MIRRGDAEQDRSRSLSAALHGRDTPREIVDRLHGEMQAVMAAPEMQQKILAIGLIPHESPSVEGIQRYIKAETEKWGTLVRQLGLEGSQ